MMHSRRMQAYLLQRRHSGSAPADVQAEALWYNAMLIFNINGALCACPLSGAWQIGNN